MSKPKTILLMLYNNHNRKSFPYYQFTEGRSYSIDSSEVSNVPLLALYCSVFPFL